MFNDEDSAYTNVERIGGVTMWMSEARESGNSHKCCTQAKE